MHRVISFAGLALLGGCASTTSWQSDDGALVPRPTSASLSPTGAMRGPSAEHLGMMLFFDASLSANQNQACASCHGANVGWTGPDEPVNRGGGVYEGSIAERYGNRKPPSSAYAMRSPILSYDAARGFVGGNFSDGRATGWDLGSAVADQARGPYLNPVEQALPDAATLVQRVCSAHYGRMLQVVYGQEVCTDVDKGYAAIAQAVAAFESSPSVSPYNSKYDAVLHGDQQLSDVEQRGLELFNGKAQCSVCHTSDGTAAEPPAFSDFGYDNIGVPKNPDNPFYTMDKVAVNGAAINPDGTKWVDPGLGSFLRTLAASDSWHSAPYVPASVSSLSAAQLSQLADENTGKHRVPTLRNVDRRPTPDFVKAYTHNGYFKSLKGLVHFYNTRDVLPRCASDLPEQQAMAAGCWPAPEVAQGVDSARTGKLGLTAEEEDALVAFLTTLNDSGGAMMPGHMMNGPMGPGCRGGRHMGSNSCP